MNNIKQCQSLRYIHQLDGCVYSAEEDIDIDTECYIDDYPNFDDDDNELPLAFVEQNGLKFCFSDENILDVVGACLHQKADPTQSV